MSDSTPTTEKAPFRLRDLGKMFGGSQSSGRQFGILGALVVIIVLFEILTGGKTLDPVNLINLVNGNAYVLVLAVGMVMVIVAGHIDLSVGSVAAFVGIVVAQAMKAWDFAAWMPFLPDWAASFLTVLAGVLLGLVIGALVGAWQGWWVAYVGVPAFIVTLAGMLLFRGANQFVGNSTSIPVPREFTYIGGGFLPDPDLGIPFNVPTLILGVLVAIAIVWQERRLRSNQRKMGATSAPVWVSVVKVVVLLLVVFGATYLFASGRPGTSFPIAGIILGILVLGYSFLTNNTTIGRHIYAVGGNWRAAELSGVNIRRVNFFVMANMSIIAALAGMLWIARSVASGPGDGVGWELDAIAAVFIGGAAVSGGIGTIVGSIVGGLVIAVLNNGLQLLSVGADRVQMIKGLVLLVAVGIDVYSKRQGKPSIIGLLTRGRRTGLDETPVPAAPQGTQTPTPAGGAQETARPKDLTPEG
jgi:putative multiple sugar transport system permease protein